MLNLNNKLKTLVFSSCVSLLGVSSVYADSHEAPKEMGGGISFSVINPLPFDSLTEFVKAILEVFIIIATPIVVLAIIYAGFLYVTARGNVEQTKKATTALTYAIIGGVIIIGSVAIAQIVGNVVDSFKAP